VPTVPASLGVVRDALDAVGYRLEGLRDVLAVEGDLSSRGMELEVFRRRLATQPGPLADVITVLALGDELPLDRMVNALGPKAVDLLIESGALREDPGTVRATLRVIPHGDLWIASDRRPAPGARADPLYVTGINPPASLLAALTVRRLVATALDLGTGNGIQAMLAREHCERVVATDINPRALAFAAFNAALNDISGIEFAEGDLFEPVDANRFDLVVSNPPYVISPDSDYAYRDSGAEPGALCARLLRELPDHLVDGGFATVLASWPITGEDWSRVPRDWVVGGCQAWLLQMGAEDPLAHSRNWNSPLVEHDGIGRFTDAVDRWVRYIADHGIHQIGYGALILHGRTGPSSVVRADRVKRGAGSASAQIERVFAAHDRLAGADAEGVASLRWRPVPELAVRRDLHSVDDGWAAGAATLTLTEGTGVEATLDAVTTEVLLAATSGSTLGEAVNAVGRALDLEPDELDRLAEMSIAMIAELFALGLLVAEPG
jgi:methylase of polypeptide subunit release factors